MGTSAPFRLPAVLAGWGLLVVIGLVAGCKLGSFPKPQFPQFAAGKGPLARMMGKKKDEPAAPPSLHFDEGDPARPDDNGLLANGSSDPDTTGEPDVRELAGLDGQPPSRDQQPTRPAGNRPPYRAPAAEMAGATRENMSPLGDKSGFPSGSQSIASRDSAPKTGSPIRRPYDVADPAGDQLKSAASDLARELDRNAGSVSSRVNDVAGKLAGEAASGAGGSNAARNPSAPGGNQFTLPGEPGEKAIQSAGDLAGEGSDRPRPPFALPPVDASQMGQPLAPRPNPSTSGQVADGSTNGRPAAPGFQLPPSSSVPPSTSAPAAPAPGMEKEPDRAMARLSPLPPRDNTSDLPPPAEQKSGAYAWTGPEPGAPAAPKPGVNSQWQNLPNTGAAPFTPLSPAGPGQVASQFAPAPSRGNQAAPGFQQPSAPASQSAELPEALRSVNGAYAPGSTRSSAPSATTWR